MHPRSPPSSADLHYRAPSLHPRPPPLGLTLIPSGESGPSSMSESSPSHGRRERRASPSCGHAVATLLLPFPWPAFAPMNMGGSVGAQLWRGPFPAHVGAAPMRRELSSPLRPSLCVEDEEERFDPMTSGSPCHCLPIWIWGPSFGRCYWSGSKNFGHPKVEGAPK